MQLETCKSNAGSYARTHTRAHTPGVSADEVVEVAVVHEEVDGAEGDHELDEQDRVHLADEPWYEENGDKQAGAGRE